MLRKDLIQALQEYEEECIEFNLILNDNWDMKILEPATIDNVFLFKIKNFDGTWKNTLSFTLCNKEQIEESRA